MQSLTTIWATWPLCATVLIAFCVYLGKDTKQSVFGILLDDRDRFSLGRLQIVTWSVVVISLIGAAALVSFIAGKTNVLGFTIADELLIVTGISLGSGAVAGALKANQDTSHPMQVAIGKPKWTQLFLTEAGAGADQTVDVAKFQNFLLTVIVVVTYCVDVLRTLGPRDADITAIPGFSTTVLALVAVSHAGYLAGKLTPPVGLPSKEVETVAERNRFVAGSRVTAENTRANLRMARALEKEPKP